MSIVMYGQPPFEGGAPFPDPKGGWPVSQPQFTLATPADPPSKSKLVDDMKRRCVWLREQLRDVDAWKAELETLERMLAAEVSSPTEKK